MRHRTLATLVALVCLSLLAPAAFAQSTGEMTGVITDPNGSVIPGAELRLTNNLTGVSMTTVSNNEGLYRFANIPPGPYQLRVTARNFAEALLNNLTVEVNRTTRVDLKMNAGNVQEHVTISVGSTSLDLENGTKGQIINSKQIENLPLTTRNPLGLTILTPGVVAGFGGVTSNRQGSDATGTTSAYVINGGIRANLGGFNEFLVDGISVTNRRDGTILALPTTDSIQQFQVQSGGMSAEFGHTVGGVVNYVTKGGTNELHGSLFEAHRSTATNARRALPIASEKPANVYNQFGGVIGGPVYLPKLYDGRNKTFFFFAYDGQRFVRKNPQTVTIPTAKMRNGDFSELSASIFDPASNAAPASRTRFADNQIPAARFNPIGKKILDTFPLPNLPGTANNYAGINRVFTPIDNYTLRFDHALNERHRMNFRLTKVNSISIASFPLGDVDQSTQDLSLPTRSYTFNYNFTITPTMVYNATAGYVQFRRFFNDASGNTVGAGFFNYSVTPAPESGTLANVRPVATFDIYRGIGTGGAQNQIAELFQINQSLAWVLGKHVLRLGTDLRRYQTAGFVTGGAANGNLGFSSLQTSNGAGNTGNSAASALLGLPNTFLIQQVPAIGLSNNVPAVYIADDYKIATGLTLNLGLRWEAESAMTERFNRVGYFDSTTVNSRVNRAGVFRYAGLDNPRAITTGDYNNFGPRIGFAYTPGFGQQRLVVRGAFGVYYAPIPTVGYYSAAPGFESIFNPIKPNATAPAIALTNSYTLPANTGPQGEAAYLGIAFTQPLNRQVKNPVIYQWNFGLQQELARNLVVEVQYSGNRGVRLLGLDNINLPQESLIGQAIAAQQASGRAGDAQTFLNQTIQNPLAGLVPGTLGAATITRANTSTVFPQYGAISALQNNRDSIYHSLQSKLEKRLSPDLNFLLAYTFSKGIGNVVENNYNSNERPNQGASQNPYNLRDARGVISYDRTHLFSGAAVYSLPFGKGRRWLNSGFLSHVVGDFQLTSILLIQSGVPLAITQSDANGLGLGGARPDVVGDPREVSASTRGTDNPNGTVQWIDRNAYRVVNGRFGTAPVRDSRLRGPGFFQLDFGMQRDFHFTERVFLRFRAEAFNALNHTNYTLPEQNLNSPAFGQISAVYDPRVFQFGLEIKF